MAKSGRLSRHVERASANVRSRPAYSNHVLGPGKTKRKASANTAASSTADKSPKQ